MENGSASVVYRSLFQQVGSILLIKNPERVHRFKAVALRVTHEFAMRLEKWSQEESILPKGPFISFISLMRISVRQLPTGIPFAHFLLVLSPEAGPCRGHGHY